MRFICLAVGLAAFSASVVQAAEIRVMSPGVIANSGLREVSAAFTKKTGVAVTIIPEGMGKIVADFTTGSPSADLVMLPMDLMATLALDKGIKPGFFTPLGRVQIGLFKKAEASQPDISSMDKLIVVMKDASAVLYSDPASGSMQASMSDQLLKRPEFNGVKGKPVPGDAEPALKKGDGDGKALGLGLIHGPHASGQATGNPFLVGTLPSELGMHMDMATAVSARSADAKDAQAFIGFMLSPEAAALWAAKGVDPY